MHDYIYTYDIKILWAWDRSMSIPKPLCVKGAGHQGMPRRRFFTSPENLEALSPMLEEIRRVNPELYEDIIDQDNNNDTLILPMSSGTMDQVKSGRKKVETRKQATGDDYVGVPVVMVTVKARNSRGMEVMVVELRNPMKVWNLDRWKRLKHCVVVPMLFTQDYLRAKRAADDGTL